MPRVTAADLERVAREVRDAMDALLAPSLTKKRGTVLADILYRMENSPKVDGRGTSSPGARSVPTEKAGDPKDPLHARTMTPAKAEQSRTGSSSTETAAQALLTGLRQPDPLANAARDLIRNLGRVSAASRVVDRRREVIMGAADGRRGREDSLHYCNGCHRPVAGGEKDPIRNGLCTTCRTRFDTWWRPRHEAKITVALDKAGARAHWCRELAERWEDHAESGCPLCIEAKAS